MIRRNTCWIVVTSAMAFIVCSPMMAFAEVMDKEASPLQIWAMALFPGFIGLLGLRFLPRAAEAVVGLVTAAVGGIFLLSVYLEIADPSVGPAIAAEAGHGYVFQFWAAAAIFVALEAVGLFIWARRKSNKRFNTDVLRALF